MTICLSFSANFPSAAVTSQSHSRRRNWRAPSANAWTATSPHPPQQIADAQSELPCRTIGRATALMEHCAARDWLGGSYDVYLAWAARRRRPAGARRRRGSARGGGGGPEAGEH